MDEASIYEVQVSRINVMKKRMTLDLNSNSQRTPMKRQRVVQDSTFPSMDEDQFHTMDYEEVTDGVPATSLMEEMVRGNNSGLKGNVNFNNTSYLLDNPVYYDEEGSTGLGPIEHATSLDWDNLSEQAVYSTSYAAHHAAYHDENSTGLGPNEISTSLDMQKLSEHAACSTSFGPIHHTVYLDEGSTRLGPNEISTSFDPHKLPEQVACSTSSSISADSPPLLSPTTTSSIIQSSLDILSPSPLQLSESLSANMPSSEVTQNPMLQDTSELSIDVFSSRPHQNFTLEDSNSSGQLYQNFFFEESGLSVQVPLYQLADSPNAHNSPEAQNFSMGTAWQMKNRSLWLLHQIIKKLLNDDVDIPQQQLENIQEIVNGDRNVMIPFANGNGSPHKELPSFRIKGLQQALLTSPDVQMLKLDSPELEKLIMQTSHGMPTPTPGGTTTPYFTAPAPPKQITEAQELFAKGFEQSLAQFHAHEAVPEHHNSNNTYTNLEPPQTQQQQQVLAPVTSVAVTSSYGGGDPSGVYLPAGVMIKEEPQTVPSVGGTPPLSPINMENQEKIKLERKRQRNRIAASKCRRRKLERIARLEDKVKGMKNENQELTVMIQRLREQIFTLKQEVCEHVKSGCPITHL